MQCPNCHAEVAPGTSFCHQCGASVGATAGAAASSAASAPGVVYPTPVAPPSSGLSDTAAGAIAYLTFIPAVIFLVLEPYNRNAFVRFHAFQCILLTVLSIVVRIAIVVLFMTLHFIPILGPLVGVLASVVVSLVFFIAWLIAIVKAAQGVKYKLPFVGDYAEKLANGGTL